MARKREDLDRAPAREALSTLGDLLRRRGLSTAPAPPPAAAPPAPAACDQADLARCGKIVVRRERKGHGGKTLTVIDGLGLAPAQLEALARALRKALGCGGRAADGCVSLQGDRAEAAEAWLRARGARQVVRGN